MRGRPKGQAAIRSQACAPPLLLICISQYSCVCLPPTSTPQTGPVHCHPGFQYRHLFLPLAPSSQDVALSSPPRGCPAWPGRPVTVKVRFPAPSTAPLSSSPPLPRRTIPQFGELPQTWVRHQFWEKSMVEGKTSRRLRRLLQKAARIGARPLPPHTPCLQLAHEPKLRRPSPWV